jgi:hypothetical protein
VVRADRIMHGKTSMIYHRSQGVFKGLPQPFEATRYHSLVLQRYDSRMPDGAGLDRVRDGHEIMGVRHVRYNVQGVQFHGVHPHALWSRPVAEFPQVHQQPLLALAPWTSGSPRPHRREAGFVTDQTQDVAGQIMTGASDAQIGAFLMGLRMKGETLDEITSAVMVMRRLARRGFRRCGRS